MSVLSWIGKIFPSEHESLKQSIKSVVASNLGPVLSKADAYVTEELPAVSQLVVEALASRNIVVPVDIVTEVLTEIYASKKVELAKTVETEVDTLLT